MAIDTNVDKLVINKLTKAQYQEAQKAGSIVDTEIYMLTDDDCYYTAIEVDAKLDAIPEIYTQDTEPTEFSEGAIWVDTSNKIEEVASDNTAMKQILNTIFHIGYIYISSSSTNPADIYGVGTWQQIKDTFILAAGDTYAAGATGGETEHTLTIDEMPAHTHPLAGYYNSANGLNSVTLNNGSGTGGTASYTPVKSAGGGAAHNNMPPYITKYVWERIA